MPPRSRAAAVVPRPVRGFVVALGCVLATVWAVDAVTGAEPARYEGRRLVHVLQELRDRGLDLIYSSAVVGRELRVTVEPLSTDPRKILAAVLDPLGLRAEEGPRGSILVLPRGQEPGRVHGRVTSLVGGTPVAGAAVGLGGIGTATRSAADGTFEVRVPAGRHVLTVSAPGFSRARISRVRVAADEDVELNVVLNLLPTYTTEVVVTPSRHSLVREEQAARRRVTGEDAVLAPTIGGDISRVVELLPGVSASDNSAAFHIRGGLAQDVALVLDGLELYDPFHLQSFQSPFSLIDTNVVDRIDFFGGGFTAELGDRHGGFVNITTVEPEDPSLRELELGSLNSRFSWRAPMPEASGSWLLSGRAWYPEAFGDTIELSKGEDIEPRFGDLYAKVAFPRSQRHALSAHALAAYDRLTFSESGETLNEKIDALTRNGYVWLRALSSWSDRWSTDTVLSGGRIERLRGGISSPESLVVVDDDRVVRFLGFKSDAAWQVSKAHVIKAGLDVRRFDARYRYSNTVQDDSAKSFSFASEPDGTSFAAYAAHRVRLSDRFAAEVGLRWDRQTYTEDNQVSPRFNARWRLSPRGEMRVALGRFQQSQRIHELRLEDRETRFGRAEVAEQAELTVEQDLGDYLHLRLDAYYRELSDLRRRYENLFEPIELFPETSVDRVEIVPERARLRGVEWMLRGETRRPLFWWVSYAWSSAEDRIRGAYVPRSWDQTHAGKFLVGYRRGERWSVSLSGSVHTGWPTTPAHGELVTRLDGSMEIEEVWGPRASERFPTYGRLDFKGRRSFSLPRGRLWLTLEVVNLTDRNNACCVDEFVFESQPDGSIRGGPRLDYWLGLTPYFSMLWEF